MGQVVFGHNEKPGGVLVDAVNNAGALYLANTRQTGATMMQEGIDQSAVVIAGSWMNHEACRFIDDDYVIILKGDDKGDVLWLGGCCSWRGQVEGDMLTLRNLGGGVFFNLASNGYLAFFDQALYTGAADILKQEGKGAIQAFAGTFLADDALNSLRFYGHSLLMTQSNQPETPDVSVPLALKVLVYTMFALLVVAAIAVGGRYMARSKAQKVEARPAGVAWDILVNSGTDESIKSAVLDGRIMTIVIEKEGRGERVVLVDTRKGLLIGSVSLQSD